MPPQTTRDLLRGTPLNQLNAGDKADLFLMMTTRQELTTRDGKPYLRVGFRDATMEVQFPIWQDSPWFEACQSTWAPGEFYRLQAVFRQSKYGPQLDIEAIRPVRPEDRDDGFDPTMCQPRSRFDPQEMFADLLSIAERHIHDTAVRQLVQSVLNTHRDELLSLPSATRNHHAFAGGYLEHVLSVTRTCLFLGEKYDAYYSELRPRLNQDVVVAGAILHDIGKLRELEQRPEGATYTSAGHLIGHVLQGRDIVRETARTVPDLPAETLLRIEHVIVSHQRLPEWGAPKPPMTPEAMIVHYADDLDAKYHMMVQAIQNDTGNGPIVASRTALDHPVYRGAESDERPTRRAK